MEGYRTYLNSGIPPLRRREFMNRIALILAVLMPSTGYAKPLDLEQWTCTIKSAIHVPFGDGKSARILPTGEGEPYRHQFFIDGYGAYFLEPNGEKYRGAGVDTLKGRCKDIGKHGAVDLRCKNRQHPTDRFYIAPNGDFWWTSAGLVRTGVCEVNG